MALCPFHFVTGSSICIFVRFDLLLLQLKRPVLLRHRLQDLRVTLEEFVVYPPEASNVLLAAATSASVVAHMHSKDVTREAVAMEVHGYCNLGSSKAYIFSPNGHLLFGGITDMTYETMLDIRVTTTTWRWQHT
jgi:hypothetical protein